MRTTRRPLSGAQRSLYWRAHRSACVNLGIWGKEEQDKYRKEVMFEACGKRSISELNNTTEFDAVMHRFCIDGGDFEGAAKFAVANLHREAVLVKILCCQIMQLKGVENDPEKAHQYLAGILDQSRIANGLNATTNTYWMDVAPGMLLSLISMLDTHRRRLVKAAIAAAGAVDTVAFMPNSRYSVSPYMRHSVPSNYYSNLSDLAINVR